MRASVGDTDEIVHLIRSGAAELAFTVRPVSRHGIDCEHIGQGEVVLALPPGWRNTLADPMPIEMLNGLPMIVDRGFGRDYLAEIRGTKNVEPDVVVDISEAGDLLPLLAAGAGAALLPMRQAMEARRRDATLRILDPAPARDIYALTERAVDCSQKTESRRPTPARQIHGGSVAGEAIDAVQMRRSCRQTLSTLETTAQAADQRKYALDHRQPTHSSRGPSLRPAGALSVNGALSGLRADYDACQPRTARWHPLRNACGPDAVRPAARDHRL